MFDAILWVCPEMPSSYSSLFVEQLMKLMYGGKIRHKFVTTISVGLVSLCPRSTHISQSLPIYKISYDMIKYDINPTWNYSSCKDNRAQETIAVVCLIR